MASQWFLISVVLSCSGNPGVLTSIVVQDFYLKDTSYPTDCIAYLHEYLQNVRIGIPSSQSASIEHGAARILYSLLVALAVLLYCLLCLCGGHSSTFRLRHRSEQSKLSRFAESAQMCCVELRRLEALFLAAAFLGGKTGNCQFEDFRPL